MSAMNPPTRSTKGSVLIVVMVLCLGLISMVLVFGNAMTLAYRGQDNSLAGQQAEQAIEGAARYAEYLMTQVDRPGAAPDPTSFSSDTLPVGDAKFWFIGVPAAGDPVDQPAFGLVDEASKLNLNTATNEMLQGLPGMTPDLAAAILAWRKTASSSGTDSAAATSFPVKNGPFESVEELALLTGTDATLLYGQDLNLNHAIDPAEADVGSSFSAGSADSRIASGLLEYVTVFSREPNTLADGTTPRVNITQPDSRALTTLLTQAFTASRAREIEQKIQASEALTSVLGFYIRSGMTEEDVGSLLYRHFGQALPAT